MTGIVFNIQKACVNDGPGIRTTVFIKGCPLSCLWCHNPESQRFSREVMFRPDKCVLCGRCAAACPQSCHTVSAEGHLFDRAACLACGRCGELGCVALECVGSEMSAEEVIGKVARDKIFYDNSGGGMTLSGGEPLAQFDFSLELLRLAREWGIHTCIETCGQCSHDKLAEIAPLVDLFLFDFKESDPERHRKYTGVDGSLIRENLEYLNSVGAQIVLRCPIIPGYNDRSDHFDAIAATAERLTNVIRVELEPYHALGESKYNALGRASETAGTPDALDRVGEWIEYISARTSKPVVKS